MREYMPLGHNSFLALLTVILGSWQKYQEIRGCVRITPEGT